MVTEALETSNDAKEELMDEFILDAYIYNDDLKHAVLTYLRSFKNVRDMVLKTIAGI